MVFVGVFHDLLLTRNGAQHTIRDAHVSVNRLAELDGKQELLAHDGFGRVLREI